MAKRAMYMSKKDQFKLWQYGQGFVGEIRLINDQSIHPINEMNNHKFNESTFSTKIMPSCLSSMD